MAKFFCENQNCLLFKKTITIPKIKYILREGKLIPSNVEKCEKCGRELVVVEEKEEGDIRLNLGTFRSMSHEDKSMMLKKRAREFAKKDGSEDRKQYYREKVIKNYFGEK